MNVIIRTVLHKDQRYDTVGDWYWKDDVLHIVISQMPDRRMIWAVAIHELVEALMCLFLGIKEYDVTKFDERFEQERAEGNTDEPGDDPYSPYIGPHSFASGIERIFASSVGLKWKEYTTIVDSLVWRPGEESTLEG